MRPHRSRYNRGMSDEPNKAEWHMTEETIPERLNDGDWREIVDRLLLVLLVVVALLIVPLPYLLLLSYQKGSQPQEVVRPLPW